MTDEQSRIMSADLAQALAKIDSLTFRIKSIERDIHGNGVPGLKHEVGDVKMKLAANASECVNKRQALEAKCDKVEASHQSYKELVDSRFKIMQFFVGAASVAVIGVVVKTIWSLIIGE